MPTTRPIAEQGRPRITGNKPAALCSQLGCSPLQQLRPRISRPQLLRSVSSKTCWAHSNASCSRSTVWPLVRFLKPASQPCHGHIPSSVFLVERRGICVHPVLSVVAPAIHRVGPPAWDPGQCAMSLFPTSPHYLLPLLLTLLILSTADDRRLGAVSGFCFSFLCSSVASYLSLTPLVVCLLHVHFLFPCHLRSVGREELFACLIVSLCSNRSCPHVFSLLVSDGFF